MVCPCLSYTGWNIENCFQQFLFTACITQGQRYQIPEPNRVKVGSLLNARGKQGLVDGERISPGIPEVQRPEELQDTT